MARSKQRTQILRLCWQGRAESEKGLSSPVPDRWSSCFMCVRWFSYYTSLICFVRAMAAAALRRKAKSTPGGSTNQSWSPNSRPATAGEQSNQSWTPNSGQASEGEPRSLTTVLASERVRTSAPVSYISSGPTTGGAGPVPAIWERPDSTNNGDKFPIPIIW